MYPEQLDRDSKLPLYQQLYEILRARIASGEWRPGAMIPSEPELTEAYGVSRITLRQQGRGSFVARPALEKGMVRIVSFTEDMRQRGLTPRTVVLAAGLLPAPLEIAERLRVPPGEELVRLERLRLAEEEPLSIEEAYLIHRLCPDLLQFDFARESLREVLARAYGIRFSRARQTIRAIHAPESVAAVLGVPPDAALLYIERVTYSLTNVPVEFLRISYRGDRYVLYNELTG